METCATHGLKFDRAQHSGCVLCRRLVAAGATTPEQADTGERPRAVVTVALVAALGAVVYFAVRATSSSALIPLDVPEDTKDCIKACASDAEACNARADIEKQHCVRDVGDCLNKCEGLPVPEPGGTQLVYAWGDDPPIQEIATRIQAISERTASCPTGRGGYTTRIQVYDGVLGPTPSAAPAVALGMCVEQQMRALDVSGLRSGSYAVVVRGTPPAPKPPPARELEGRTQPQALNEAQGSVDFLTQLNKLNPKGSAEAMEHAAKRDALGESKPVAPPASTSLAPRVLAVSDLASEVMQSRGALAVLVLYAADCSYCAPFLRGLSPAIQKLQGSVRFHIYSIDHDEDHQQWLTYVKPYQSIFSAVRLSTPDRTRPFYKAQFSRLGLRWTSSVPQFVVINADGSIARQGIGLSGLPLLMEELSRKTGQKL